MANGQLLKGRANCGRSTNTRRTVSLRVSLCRTAMVFQRLLQKYAASYPGNVCTNRMWIYEATGTIDFKEKLGKRRLNSECGALAIKVLIVLST